jgi:hypothetical protein
MFGMTWDRRLDVDTFDTGDGTIVGHANAAGAEAVGAAAWYQTEAWGSPLRPQCRPACLDSFSSAGGTPILFDTTGRLDWRRHMRDKPGLIGPDAGNTSFFYFKLGFNVPGTTEDDIYPNFSRALRRRRLMSPVSQLCSSTARP